MKKTKKKISLFHKFFIPHKHNEYHPHLFRNVSVLTIFCISAFLLGVSYGNSIFLKQTVLGANIASNVLIDLANENRAINKIPPLRKNEKLAAAANMKAVDMIKNNYFAHFSPNGTTPWYFITKAGYDFLYAGENLAINFNTSKEVDTAWMNSPTHRENLLNSKFKDIGIATVDGPFQNAQTVYIVQMFGSANPKVERSVQEVPKLISDVPTALAVKPKVIQQDKNFIAIKNEANKELEKEENIEMVNDGVVLGTEIYSTWLDRFVFDSSFYIQFFYIILIIILSFAILLRMIIEYRKQHIKHLIYSGLVLLALIILATLNLNFINQL